MHSKSSIAVKDKALLEEFTRDPNFPYLVSFPRTGSHWLRMLMELYFETPALIRLFYCSHASHFTCLHHHDLDLSLSRQRVLYLFRDPVDTLYSQLRYHQEDIYDEKRVAYWSECYQQHLAKWLFNEGFTKEKLIIEYETLASSPDEVFKALCVFLAKDFDKEKLFSVHSQVSKQEVRKKTSHDPQVINRSESYEEGRAQFSAKFAQQIRDHVTSYRAYKNQN